MVSLVGYGLNCDATSRYCHNHQRSFREQFKCFFCIFIGFNFKFNINTRKLIKIQESDKNSFVKFPALSEQDYTRKQFD